MPSWKYNKINDKRQATIWPKIIIIVIIINITLFMSQVYLAEHRGSTNWGDRKSNQLKCCFFAERGKPEYPGKNQQSREPTNSTHIWRPIRESNLGHTDGRRVLSPLRQHCSPKMYVTVKYFIEEIMMKFKARTYHDNMQWCVNSLLFYLILLIGIFFSSRAYKEEKWNRTAQYPGILFILQSTSQPVKPLVKQLTRLSLGKPAS